MVFEHGADFVLPWGVVQLLHLRKPALAQVPRSAPWRVELAYRRECAVDLRLVRARDHLNVRHRAAEVAVVVDVLHEDAGELAVFVGDVGKADLVHEVLLESFALHH